MQTAILVAGVLFAMLLILFIFGACKVASDADDEAEEFFRMMREKRREADDNVRFIATCGISDAHGDCYSDTTRFVNARRSSIGGEQVD